MANFLERITDTIGMTNVRRMEEAADAARFSPYNIQSGYGSLTYDPSQRLFTSSVSPDVQRLQDRYLLGLERISPQSELGIMREQAQPYNEALMTGMENRLFSQGRLDHSQVYAPGGPMRGLFDAMLNQDLIFQQQARQNAWAREQQLLRNYMGLFAPEQNLFQAGMGMGQIGMQGQMTGANILAESSEQLPKAMDSIIGGIMTYMMGGGIGG